MTEAIARRIDVEGVVQGVGFRPFVWRLAHRCGVAGWVRNGGGRVEIHAEGTQPALDRFCRDLQERPPPLAVVARITAAPTDVAGAGDFVVDASEAGAGDGTRLVSPDAATCPACLRELHDEHDRRYGYPFTNCTDCGPRFTIIDDLPYDRERTAMRDFEMCTACATEYRDPASRRFHAEPVACPECGPALVLVDDVGRPLPGPPVREAAGRLERGEILAVKGLGGYQLACDATAEEPVARLRDRKRRPDKPFAVMVADVETAHAWFPLRSAEAALLRSPAAPIVLVASGRPLAPAVAPGHRRHGIMLASTPLHRLLLDAVGRPLVMTSGNRTDEPIAIDDRDALTRLGAIADAFLVHDRAISARYDDSVTSVRRGRPAVLRRARGLAPSPIGLPVAVRPTLAAGADLHAAFCLARDRDAFVSPHIGDLDSDAAVEAWAEALDRYRRLFRIEPEIVVHDLHPDLLSTHLALALGRPALAVQHHHAHVAAVAAEHGLTGPVLGVAFDGFGLGDDGAMWGGELLLCDGPTAERVGHLRPVPQPGGDAATHHPARLSLVHAADADCLEPALELLGLQGASTRPSGLLGGATVDQVLAQARRPLLAPATTSAGRLFDAVAALAGLGRSPSFEGQPAMLLEQIVEPGTEDIYPVRLEEAGSRLVIDSRPAIRGVVRDLLQSPAVAASRFHGWLAAAVVETTRALTARIEPLPICLAGGVWANDRLLDLVASTLEREGRSVFHARRVPPGDGGLALGQALVGHARLEAGP